MRVRPKFARIAFALVTSTFLVGAVVCWASGPLVAASLREMGGTRSAPIVWSALPTPVVVRAHWTSFTNSNSINALALRDRLLWAATEGGAVAWDQRQGTSVKFTVEHGLPGNRVTSVAAAPDGLLWFGTVKQGVASYDGSQWNTFTTRNGLASNDIRDLLAGEDGALWAATAQGLSRFDGRTWKTFTHEGTDSGLGSNDVRGLAAARRGIWAATSKGVSYFSGQEWRTFTFQDGLANDDVFAVAVSPDGSLWAGTRVGLSHYDGSHWEKLTTADGLLSNEVHALAVTPDGAVWVGFGGAAPGLTRLDGQQWESFTSAGDVSIANVQTIEVDESTGAIWAGTSSGLLRFDGVAWEAFSLPSDLPSNDLRGLVAARGALWTATPGGISRYDGVQWRHFTTADGLPANDARALTIGPDGAPWAAFSSAFLGVARPISGDAWETIPCRTASPASPNVYAGAPSPDGSVWFATDRGVSYFARSSWRHFTAADGLPDNLIQTLAVGPAGEVWAGTPKGLAVYSSNSWRTVAGDDVRLLSVSPEGEVWALTSTGIARLSGDGLLPVDGLPLSHVRGLLANAGSLWLATSNGVHHFDGANWRTFTTADGLASDDVAGLTLSPDGILWAGFADATLGFSWFDGSRWLPIVETTLPDDHVNAILPAPDGNVWLGTPLGVIRQGPAGMRHYTVADGLPSNEIVALVRAYDSVWAGTPSGVARFDGQRWQAFDSANGLLRDSVRAMAVAPDGRLWVGFQNVSEGLSVFDGARWSSQPFAAYAPDGPPSLMAAAPDGQLWVGTPEGVAWYNGHTWRSFAKVRDASSSVHSYPLGQASAVQLAPDGSVWALTPERLARFNGRVWEFFDVQDSVGLRDVFDFVVSDDGAVWAASPTGLNHYDGHSWRLFNSSNGLPDDEIRQVTVAPDGSVWVATITGVAQYANGLWHSFEDVEGTPLSGVEKIAAGGNGVVWALGRGPSLNRFDGSAWSPVPLPPDLTPTDLLVDGEGGVWLAQLGGEAWSLARYDGSRWTRLAPNGAASESRLNDLQAAPDGSMWLLSDAGIRRYAHGQWTAFSMGPGEVPLSMSFAADSTGWVSTGDGSLWRYREGEWVRHALTHLDPDAQIRAMAFTDDGKLWAGGDYISASGAKTGYVAFFDGQRWTPDVMSGASGYIFPVQQIKPAPNGSLWVYSNRLEPLGERQTAGDASRSATAQPVPDPSLEKFLEGFRGGFAFGPDGSLWLAEDRGHTLRRFGADGSSKVENPIGWDADVTAMELAPDGALWVGTEAGVARYDGQRWQVYRSLASAFGTARGRLISMTATSDGSLWYGTSAGGAKRYFNGQSRHQSFRTFLSKYETRAIFQSADGAVWLGTMGGGVARVTGSQNATFELYSPDPALTSDTVQSLAITADGSAWLGTRDGVIVENSIICERVLRVGREVNALATVADPEGGVWVGTEGKGPLRLGSMNTSPNLIGETWQGRTVSAMAAAHDGALWFASGSSVARLGEGEWQLFEVDPGTIAGEVQSIAIAPDHGIWLGTLDGVAHFNGRQWVRWTTSEGLGDDTVQKVVAAPDGSVWFATPGGLSRYRP